MSSRRFFMICLVLSVALAIGMMFAPLSMGDARNYIGWFAILCIPVFLIALIVSSVRSKKKRSTIPTAPGVSVPVQPVAPQPVAPAAPAPSVKRTTTVERVHVRGVDHYGKNIESVGWENPDYSLTKRELQEDFEGDRVYKYTFDVKADLVPEPDNEYDPNAIMVQANGLCIGHVPKGSTAHIRNLMESGRIKSMILNIGGGKYKEVYEVDDGEYELYNGDLKYSAVLELHLTDEQIGNEMG